MPAPSGYTLTYAEEFNGSSLPSPWQLGYYFSNTVPSSAVTVSGGALHLAWSRGGVNDISVSSSQTFHYGYFEVRMKWTVSNGAWPAFWFIPPSGIANTGEIDVFEGQGDDNHAYFATLHEWNGSSQLWFSDPNRFNVSVDFSQWHTYALLWEPGGVFSWYLDDVLIHTVTATGHPIFDTQSVFPILSMQMGNDWSVGNLSGVTADTLTNDIDYFRVYQGSGSSTGTGGGGTPAGGVDGGPTGPSTGTGGTGTGSGFTPGAGGNIVQIAKNAVATLIPGGDFAPGTRAMLSIDASFGSPNTAGNTILVAFVGDIIAPGVNLTSGPTPGIFSVAGGSLPDRTYYVQATYQDVSGKETAASPEESIFVAANNLLSVFAPNNPNFPGGSVPGASGWNIYVGTSSGSESKQNASLLSFASGWTEPTSGLISGAAASSSQVSDTVGNSYSRAIWVDGGIAGSEFGTAAMGMFYATAIAGGSNTIQVKAQGYNFNPFFDVNAELMVIAVEISGFTPSLQSHGYLQQGNSTGTLSVALTNSLSASITSGFGNQTESSMAVVDFLSGSGDDFFVVGTGNNLPSPLPTPTLTGGAYALVDTITSPNAVPMWLWTSGQTVSLPSQHVRGNIDWDQVGLDARHGNILGRLIQYSDGTHVAGAVPVFLSDGTLTSSGVSGGTLGGNSGGPPITVNGAATVFVNGSPASFDDVVLVNGS